MKRHRNDFSYMNSRLLHSQGGADDDVPEHDPVRSRAISAIVSERIDRYMEEAKVRLARQVTVYSAKDHDQEFLRSLTDPKGW